MIADDRGETDLSRREDAQGEEEERGSKDGPNGPADGLEHFGLQAGIWTFSKIESRRTRAFSPLSRFDFGFPRFYIGFTVLKGKCP
jgi:hypothetical protein